MLGLWQSALDLPHPPGWNDTFFDLGGDSLAAARLVSAVQEAYAFDLPVDRFFADPTPARLWAIITGGSPVSEPQPLAPSVGGADLVGGIEAYLRGWKGGRRSKPGELLIGYNVDGGNRPIFWVFQSYLEASWLAGALGADQPLYAMRSAVNLLPTAQYSEQTLRPLLDRYAWEILVASQGGEFVLGGNCQGGIVGLLLARRLRKIGRRPRRLFLVDWSFDYGRYDLPVVLFMGHGVDEQDLAHQSRLARFPKVRTLRVPGYYAHYFDPEHVSQIAAHIRQKPKPAKRAKHSEASGSRRLRRPSGRDTGTG